MKITNEFKFFNEKVEKILKYLFAISIILIPFDNLPYFKNILGELSFKGSVYPFILIIIIFIINSIMLKEIYINMKKQYYLIFIFIGWVFLSSFINFNSIITNNLKQRTGVEKFLLQGLVLIFMFMVMYVTEALISSKKISIQDLRKYILFSSIPVAIYGFIELLNLVGIFNLNSFIENVSYCIQTYHRGEVYYKGVRSVTGEVSYFAMYLAFALPWIGSFIFTEKNKVRRIGSSFLLLVLLILMIFSKSRTAYAIIFIQIFLFITFILLFKVEKNNKILLIKGLGIVCTIFLLFNFTKLNDIGGDPNSVSKISIKSLIISLTDPNNMSNVARGGMQQAAIKMGIDSPIFGVGLGQYGFNTEDYISERAKESDEVKWWISDLAETRESWPPAFSIYPRVLAEQGVVGLFLCSVFIINILKNFIKILWKRENDILGIALIVSYLCVLVSWWNFDTFASFGFWILTPFLVLYSYKDGLKE